MAHMTVYHVYILANKRNGTLYVGITSSLARRMYEHKNGLAEGFTRKHGIKTLVHIEAYSDLEEARRRERSLKRWKRQWKIALIERDNPAWSDLYDEVLA